MKAAGLGFRGDATEDSLRQAFDAAGGQADVLAVPANKAQSAVLKAFAASLGLEIVPVTAVDMQAAKTLTQSQKVQEKRGTGSVAEACALIVAGDRAALAGPRVVSEDRMATCAIAAAAS